jgi:hypothetical protein
MISPAAMEAEGGSEAWPKASRARAVASFVIWLIAAVFVWKMLRISVARFEAGGPSDFHYFWDAGANVLAGNAARAYTIHPSPIGEMWPLPHPPPFLLLAPALALLPVEVSLLLFLAVTGAAYLLTARQPLKIALANPTVPYNVKWAQTGFLTSAILLGGLNWVRRRPLLGGAILGAMVIKPHLGVFIPVALIAGRQWKALCATAASAAVLIGLAALAFGAGIYVAWWHSFMHFSGVLPDEFWGWSTLSSTYAFLRWWGLGSSAAYAGQAFTALAGGAMVASSWRSEWSSKAAVVPAATLLVPPYLGSNDAVMMVLPLGVIAAWSMWRAAVLWFLLLVPWFSMTMINRAMIPFNIAGGPDPTPIAAALALFFLWEREREAQSSFRMVSS